jgi:hypothetical protein
MEWNQKVSQERNFETQYFYKNLTLNYEKVDYYDENENLEEYEIYKNKKEKTIIKTFDKIAKTERLKNIILKNK